jgi:hypothetical protein
MSLVGITIAGGCIPADTPGAMDVGLPDAAVELLAPDTVRRSELSPGVVYHYLWSPRGPWAVHLIQANVSERCELAFDVLQAEPRVSGGRGHEPVSAMVARSGEMVLAAVNADFFTPEGTTVGAEIIDGRVSAAEARPTFAWRRGSEPWLGVPVVTDREVRLGWSVARVPGDGATEAVGGFPDLIDRGVRVGDLEVAARPSFAAVRHPRSGIAYDTRTGTVWVVVVDGRQDPHSAGMTLPELAQLLEALGVDEALNLDGGGSSTLVVDGRPANRPSDPEGERAVVNALALVHDSAGCAS